MLQSRKRLRLPHHPYGAGTAYHLTICTHRRGNVLATVRDGMIGLNSLGDVVQNLLVSLPSWWPDVSVAEAAIMPDHVHALLHLGASAVVTVPRVVCRFKGLVTRSAREQGLFGKSALWQRGYHDRVIRDQAEFDRVRQYIRNNPLAWSLRHEPQ